ncbi:alpha/beta fold hydrolase [Saccharothrix sp. BKS2]|uniref:thioesterase II family protein n=1 Tax=Saccharothrix sp. BKS2 TaxID=3064400 RepID=UPI0039EA7339
MARAAFTADSPWVRRSPRHAPAVRLVCVPYGGGGASVYRELADLLPDSIEVLALQLPGREDRSREDPPADLRRLVRAAAIALRPFCAGDYVLYGHCAGALLAYEVALEMGERFGTWPRRLIAAAQPAPHLPPIGPPLHELPDDHLLEVVRHRGGLPDAVLANAELLSFLLPVIRADFTLWERYEHRHGDRALPCPVTTLRGRDDAVVGPELCAPWRERTTGGWDHHEVDGDHYFINRLADSTARVLARTTWGE